MDNKTARIRPLTASDSDGKLMLFAIGKANLESLAVANRQAYGHPLIIGVWALLSLAFVHVMNWWPSAHQSLLGVLGYLKPIPAFASVAVPLMFLIDWNNRPHFEKRTQEALKQGDLLNPTTYYGKSPASGFWVLEYGTAFIGLIALDANDAKKTKKGFIRHFYVEEAYRKTNIQDDLLKHAVKTAFDKSPAIQSIEGVDALALAPHIHDCYQRAGFRLSQEYQSAGILGWWKYYTTVLQKENRKRQ
ncbi:hypothetical protein P691DRAFT_657591 [Macrolepiota fuliginosa MF-IS2]|uniref:N-acetyltransferase domain-containing protein n=1 Tax=Macrolepiota fuliginosa MF-IS2 TaxID=1400762 RepID=A0A9P5XLT9_9AGAR|nr:hypothetical protein P691DRAFT_657591 [Macrolepiota fuliginosa MF-IS2]